MEKTKRYKYIIALLTAFLLTVVGFFALQAPQSAKASESEDRLNFTGISVATNRADYIYFELYYNLRSEGVIVDISLDMGSGYADIITNKFTKSDFEAGVGFVKVPVEIERPDKQIKIKAHATLMNTNSENDIETTYLNCYSSEVSLVSVWQEALIDENLIAKIESKTLYSARKLVEAYEGDYGQKATSAYYVDLYDYRGGTNVVTNFSSSTAIYRVNGRAFMGDGIVKFPYYLQFHFNDGNSDYYLHVGVDDYGVITFYTANGFYFDAGVTQTQINGIESFYYWRDNVYEYFTFSFLESLPAGIELVNCKAGNTDVDVGLFSGSVVEENLLAEVTEWKNKYNETLSKLTAKEIELAQRNAELDELRVQKDKLESEKSSLNQQIIELNNQISQLNATVQNLETENSSLKKEREEYKASAEKSSEEVERLNETIRDNNTLIATLQSEKEALTNEKNRLQELYNGASQDIAKKVNKIDELNTEIKRLEGLLSADVSALNTIIKEKDSKISQLEKELEEAKKQANKKEDKDKNTLPTFGCGSINTGSGSGAGGIASLMATVATSMLLFYIGVNYARKKKQNQ